MGIIGMIVFLSFLLEPEIQIRSLELQFSLDRASSGAGLVHQIHERLVVRQLRHMNTAHNAMMRLRLW